MQLHRYYLLLLAAATATSPTYYQFPRLTLNTPMEVAEFGEKAKIRWRVLSTKAFVSWITMWDCDSLLGDCAPNDSGSRPKSQLLLFLSVPTCNFPLPSFFLKALWKWNVVLSARCCSSTSFKKKMLKSIPRAGPFVSIDIMGLCVCVCVFPY